MPWGPRVQVFLNPVLQRCINVALRWSSEKWSVLVVFEREHFFNLYESYEQKQKTKNGNYEQKQKTKHGNYEQKQKTKMTKLNELMTRKRIK